MRMMCVQKAQLMWAAFDDNQKTMVRFGMFPFAEMTEAEKLGFDGRLLAVALMDVAKANGGMIA